MVLQLGQPEMRYLGDDIGGDSPELEELRNSLSSESNGVPEWNRGHINVNGRYATFIAQRCPNISHRIPRIATADG